MKTSQFLRFMKNTHPVIFIGMWFVLDIGISSLFLLAPEGSMDNASTEKIAEKMGQFGIFVFGVILAPIIETFLHHFLVIKGLRMVLKKAALSFYIAVPVSAVFFALIHPYSIYYITATFFTGLILGCAFYLGQYRRDMPAFLIVVILHSLYNLFASAMDFVL